MSVATALLISILLPLISAVIVLVVGSDQAQLVRRLALISSLLTLMLALRVVAGFDSAGDEYLKSYIVAAAPGEDASQAPFEAAKSGYAVSEYVWLPASSGLDIRFSTGLDGLSVWMYGLSAVLMVSAVLVSWTAVKERVALFYCMLLLLEAGCLGVFAARDIIVFYVFFEFTLIPLFFLIGIWGSEQRRYAAIKFFLYTLFGSLFTFLGLLTLVLWQQDPGASHIISGSIPELIVRYSVNPLPANVQFWVFIALFAGFAIKVPLFPLHTWLPLAHVQAPTAGSVFLAGILLKIGTYGFLRFNMPLLPDATVTFLPWIMWLSVIGIIYGAMVALVQSDMKRLIAYSSVSHLGFCMLGIFALNPMGLQGGALQMVNHGISTGALFALIGMLYERYHTREIARFSGLTRRLPVMAFFMLLFTFSSIGLPGMNGFAGEIMILAGTFQRAWAESAGELAHHLRWVSVLAVSGVVLGAWYMLTLVQRVFFGPLLEPVSDHHHAEDLSTREVVALLPLAILVFWIGLYPQYFIEPMRPALQCSSYAAARLVNAQGGEGEAAAMAQRKHAQEKLSRAY